VGLKECGDEQQTNAINSEASRRPGRISFRIAWSIAGPGPKPSSPISGFRRGSFSDAGGLEVPLIVFSPLKRSRSGSSGYGSGEISR
jgi:hypothetical protein